MSIGVDETSGGIWARREFRTYIGSTGFSGMAIAMQQLLLSWLLIGILELAADVVGVIQAVIGIPSIFLMLLGGARSDASDPRRLLTILYALSPVFPVFLVLAEFWVGLAVWNVMVWGVGLAITQALSMPAQQAILNNIAGKDVQKGVTIATAIGMVVQVVGLLMAGQLDRVGVGSVLIVQAIAFGFAAYMTSKLKQIEMPPEKEDVSAWQQIKDGLHATASNKVVASVLTINFISSIFNAGSMMTVFPFIVKRVYEGDAFILSLLMALFFVFAAISNAIILRFMPLARPGRLYLILQLSRIIVIGLLYMKGDWWLLTTAVMLWGFNMGLTSNLARTVVQECAEEAYRGRILSVFTVSMMGTGPIGAVILGVLIETFGTLNALLPAIFVSIALAVYGTFYTPVWRYQSPAS